MVNTSARPAEAVSELSHLRHDWLVAGIALAVGVAVWGVVFRAEIVSAVNVWLNSDAYNHCFLVVPVALYLASERWRRIAATPPHPAPWLVLLAIPAALAWFVANRLGIMEAQQLMAMTLLQVMVIAIIGVAAWRTLAAPLLYLYFLVPFGEFLVPPLQNLVIHFATKGLTLIGIPTYSNGIVIEIPEGSFMVHTACSGLRFLIASAAFGVLYACVMYVSPLRRLVFSLLAVALAIVGNCFRVLGTILIAHWIGNAQAVEANHVIWGWGFYVVLGAILVAVGYGFREDQRFGPPPAPAPSARIGAIATVALAAIILVTAAPRVAADYLHHTIVRSAIAIQAALPRLPGCSGPTAAPSPPASPQGSGHADSAAGIYQCAGGNFEIAVYRYSPRVEVRPFFTALHAAEFPPEANDTLLQTGAFSITPAAGAPLWSITEATTFDGRFLAIATALWLDGRPSETDIRGRLRQALNTVRPAPVSPLLVVVTHIAQGGPTEARQAIDKFLSATSGLADWVQPFVAKLASR